MKRLTTWAQSRLPDLGEQIYALILDRIPMYRTDEVVPRGELRESIDQNLRFMLTALSEGPAPDHTTDLAAPTETGRRRAHQGAPLPEVIRCYRIGFAVLWDSLLDQAKRRGSPGAQVALLAAVNQLWDLTDEHAMAITEAYRAETSGLLVAQQRRRSALVEALFTGQPGPHATWWEAANLLGLTPDSQLMVVAAETQGLAEESLAEVENELADRGIVSAWRLSPTLQLGIVSLDPGQLNEVLSFLQDAATARVGISPLYEALTETPRALHLARVALGQVPSGGVEVRVFSESPLAALMACEPKEGQRLVRQVLGAVLDLPDEDSTTLLDTLRMYLDAGGSAERAAKVLYCHPNTVRYRLRRLHDLTGRSLSDPGELAELVAASQALWLNRTHP